MTIYPPHHHSFGETQNLTVKTISNSISPHSLTPPLKSEVLQTDDKDIETSQLPTVLQGSEAHMWSTLLTLTASALPTFASPHLNDQNSSSVFQHTTFSDCSEIPPSIQAEVLDRPYSAPESRPHTPTQKEPLSKCPDGCSATRTKMEETPSSLNLLFDEDSPVTSGLVTNPINSETAEQFSSLHDSHHQPFSETTCYSVPSVGSVSVVEEDKCCDPLQMSLSEGLTLVTKEVCNQTEIETHALLHSLHDFTTDDNLEESRKVQQTDTNVSETPKGLLFYPTKDLIEIDSLDLVFQTNDPEVEKETVDAFLQDDGAEGLVYWAEPIQVSNPNSVLEESQSQEPSDELVGIESLVPSTGRPMPLSLLSDVSADAPSSLIPPPFLSSSHGVSLQMSFPLASHIVHRKDIPYVINPKSTCLPSVLPLDTSTPFRAVQSWTDLQIKRNILTNMFMQELFHTVPTKATASKSSPETTQTHKLPQNCFTAMTRNNCIVSDPGVKGAWPDEELHMREGEHHLQDQRLVNTIGLCACCCHTPDTYNTQQSLGKSPVSNSVLSMMLL